MDFDPVVTSKNLKIYDYLARSHIFVIAEGFCQLYDY